MTEPQFDVNIPLLAKNAVAWLLANLHVEVLTYFVVWNFLSVKITRNCGSRCTQSKLVLKMLQLTLIRHLAQPLSTTGFEL